MQVDNIFVYGSLRSELRSPAYTVLMKHAERLGEAVFNGKLYMIDWYPGVVDSEEPDDIVVGEVYKMIDKEILLTKLDRYEGCSPSDPKPHDFIRKERVVKLKGGKELNAWIYLYNQSTSGKMRISFGDFVTFKNKT